MLVRYFRLKWKQLLHKNIIAIVNHASAETVWMNNKKCKKRRKRVKKIKYRRRKTKRRKRTKKKKLKKKRKFTSQLLVCIIAGEQKQTRLFIFISKLRLKYEYEISGPCVFRERETHWRRSTNVKYELWCNSVNKVPICIVNSIPTRNLQQKNATVFTAVYLIAIVADKLFRSSMNNKQKS